MEGGEEGGCEMLTAEFSDGVKAGALLFEVHLHFRSFAPAVIQNCLQ